MISGVEEEEGEKVRGAGLCRRSAHLELALEPNVAADQRYAAASFSCQQVIAASKLNAHTSSILLSQKR